MKQRYLYRGWKSTVLPGLFYLTGLVIIAMAVMGIIEYLGSI